MLGIRRPIPGTSQSDDPAHHFYTLASAVLGVAKIGRSLTPARIEDSPSGGLYSGPLSSEPWP